MVRSSGGGLEVKSPRVQEARRLPGCGQEAGSLGVQEARGHPGCGQESVRSLSGVEEAAQNHCGIGLEMHGVFVAVGCIVYE